MSDRQDLNPNPRSKRASNVEKNDPRRGPLQFTRSGILCEHNRVHPDPNFSGLHKVSDPRVRDQLRLGEACQHGGERNGEKQLLHVPSKDSICAASMRAQRFP
jgi:hypothetical protein